MSDTTTATDAGLAEARRRVLGRLLRGEIDIGAPRGAIPRAAGGPDHPVSHQQAQLLFMHELHPESPFYNLATAHLISAGTDVALLERALSEIVRRHEALRTVFRWEAGEPRQLVQPPSPFRVEREELRGPGGEPAPFHVVADRVRAWSARPFDLARGPLFRCTLGRVSDADHVLVFTCHHLVSDGWSLAVAVRELAELYAAFGRGEPSPLPEPRVHYPDYAVWQRAHLEGALERQLAFWTEHLRGAPTAVELPFDRPRSRAHLHRGAMHRFLYPQALVDRLNGVAREVGVTLNMVFLAAVALLLRRYGGEDDVVVGAGLGNRNREELEEMIGYLVQPGAVRTRLDGDPTFREVLRRARASVLEAEAHQEVPFHRVVEALGVPRDPSRNPLFQVMYVHRSWVRAHQVDERLRRALDLRPFYHETGDTFVETGAARFDLLWTMGEGRAGMAGSVEYSTELFDAGTVARMEAQLRAILEAGAAAPDTPLSRLPLLGDADRAALEAWNRTESEYPADRCIHHLFEAEAAARPDAVALVGDDASLTYRALDERANRLARRLARVGVGAETRVGVCLEPGIEMVVALLAVLKAGGAYVPLDPGYPAARLEWMLADAEAAVVVTRGAAREALPAVPGVRTLDLDSEAAEIAAESAAGGSADPGPKGLAYVVYTSGSTGRPKGVGVEHRGVVRLVRGARYARFGPDEVVLQGAPVSFDASTLEIWGALLNGARLVLLPGGDASLETIGRTLVRHGVTTLWLTAGLFQAMAEERLEDLHGVRQLLAGGDVLPPGAVRKVRERFPACRVINGYGPTENTTFTACHTVPDGWSGGPVPIGRPVSNTRAYVLDGGLALVPVGAPGELYAGGDGVARGYLGDPARTAERFVPDPFSPVPGARMYRTGDRARWLSDGTLEFRGRLDAQVKIRGFRIEPGEVEAVLRRHEGVADCVVAARTDDGREPRLVAYVVGEAKAEALAAHLRRNLPEYMVPGAFVFLDALPRMSNGKLDRGALPAPASAVPAEEHVAPRTPVEAVLAEIWREVLGVERVGVNESFFKMGGDSLRAMRVASRVRALGAELTVRTFFDRPTVAELAEWMEAVLWKDE